MIKTFCITRKEYVFDVLRQAKIFIRINEEIENRAKELTERGIKPLDALHLASAEQAKVDCFCTCDDKFLKKMKSIKDLKVKIASPIELIREVENNECAEQSVSVLVGDLSACLPVRANRTQTGGHAQAGSPTWAKVSHQPNTKSYI